MKESIENILHILLLSSASIYFLSLIVKEIMKIVGKKIDPIVEAKPVVNDITESVLIRAKNLVDSLILEKPELKWLELVDSAIEGLMEGMGISHDAAKRAVSTVVLEAAKTHPSESVFIRTSPDHILKMSKAHD